MPDDDELERELKSAEQLLDPIPLRLLRDAMEIFGWRTIDAELAELVFDSADTQAAEVVRGSGQPRLLTFQASDLSIELELSAGGPERRIAGRLVPARPGDVEIRYGGLQRTVTADELGQFSVTSPGSGPVSLRFRPAGSTASWQVVTDWISG
ncbi:MAG TPA: hypothetical protein VF940_31220 [Streptosporangiaceae bacterium]